MVSWILPFLGKSMVGNTGFDLEQALVEAITT
jgi:hypothetical protein